jgi:hypothetical protein
MTLTTLDARIAEACAHKLSELASVPPIAWPGLKFPADGAAFPNQFVDFVVNRIPATWATRDTRRIDATLIVTLRTKLPFAEITASETAGLIADHFNAAPFFTRNDLRVTMASPAGVLGAIYDDAWMYHPIQATVTAFHGV